jgi:hypothetical protein
LGDIRVESSRAVAGQLSVPVVLFFSREVRRTVALANENAQVIAARSVIALKLQRLELARPRAGVRSRFRSLPAQFSVASPRTDMEWLPSVISKDGHLGGREGSSLLVGRRCQNKSAHDIGDFDTHFPSKLTKDRWRRQVFSVL